MLTYPVDLMGIFFTKCIQLRENPILMRKFLDICYFFGQGLFVVASALRLNQGQNSQSFSDILYQTFTIQTVSENLSAVQ